MTYAYAFGSGCHFDCPPAPPTWQLILLVLWLIGLGIGFYFFIGHMLGRK